MHFFAKYFEPYKGSEKLDKIKIFYNNYEVYKNCKSRNKCCSSSQTYKTIREYGSEIQKAMNQKMEKQEYDGECVKRSIVEGPFEIFKEQFHVNRKRSSHRNDKTEERINLDSLAYKYDYIT